MTYLQGGSPEPPFFHTRSCPPGLACFAGLPLFMTFRVALYEYRDEYFCLVLFLFRKRAFYSSEKSAIPARLYVRLMFPVYVSGGFSQHYFICRSAHIIGTLRDYFSHFPGFCRVSKTMFLSLLDFRKSFSIKQK